MVSRINIAKNPLVQIPAQELLKVLFTLSDVILVLVMNGAALEGSTDPASVKIAENVKKAWETLATQGDTLLATMGLDHLPLRDSFESSTDNIVQREAN